MFTTGVCLTPVSPRVDPWGLVSRALVSLGRAILSQGPQPMIPGESEASSGTSLQPRLGASLPQGWGPLSWDRSRDKQPTLPCLNRVPRSHRRLGLGPRVCSQQTGSWKGDFSLLILYLRGGIQTPFPHRKPGKLGGGAGRSSLGRPRSRASCGLGLQCGGGGGETGVRWGWGSKSPERPLPTQNSGPGVPGSPCCGWGN